ncbi:MULTISPECIES: cobalamin biosynthesis protein [unclassified Sinorhizobium]|uniref:cobalamin biosynthesis protein n=1 Tax=unclassified Sinorhizobium TaxID=2613772 RepID=UPI003526645C
MGCERGTPSDETIRLAEKALQAAGIAVAQLRLLTSIDNRAQEPAILAVGKHFAIELVVFDAEALEKETPRLANPSEVVFARVGCHGVAEAAALAAAGPQAKLVLPKIKSGTATAAIAEIF